MIITLNVDAIYYYVYYSSISGKRIEFQPHRPTFLCYIVLMKVNKRFAFDGTKMDISISLIKVVDVKIGTTPNIPSKVNFQEIEFIYGKNFFYVFVDNITSKVKELTEVEIQN